MSAGRAKRSCNSQDSVGGVIGLRPQHGMTGMAESPFAIPNRKKTYHLMGHESLIVVLDPILYPSTQYRTPCKNAT
jgi:hypothetical protein